MHWPKIQWSTLLRGKHSVTPTETHAFIDLRNVQKLYETSSGGFQALKGVSLQIQSGEFVAIAGKSGSGKSTLLNMISGIDRPSSGEIFINELPIHSFDEEKLTIWRGDVIGVVFQFFQLVPTMTLIENVMLPMDFCRHYSPRKRRERAANLLKMVDMAEQSQRLPANVSGGQQQRAAIARALANDPPIIIADEPTGNLDSASAEAVFGLLEQLVQQGKTVIIVTHDMDLANRCQRIIYIADGQIVSDRLSPQWANASGQPPAAAGRSPAVAGSSSAVAEILPASAGMALPSQSEPLTMSKE